MKWYHYVLAWVFGYFIGIFLGSHLAKADDSPFKKLKDATVQAQTPLGFGTAWAYSNPKHKNLFVTAAHVCGPFATLWLNGTEVLVVKRDVKTDLCLLQAPNSLGKKGLKIALITSDRVYSVGASPNHGLHPRYGVREFRRTMGANFGTPPCHYPTSYSQELDDDSPYQVGHCHGDFRLDEVSLVTYPGESGSAVTNERGEVVGVLNMTVQYKGQKKPVGDMVILEDLREFLRGQ